MKSMGWKNKTQEYIRKHKLRKRWLKLTAVLAILVAAATGAAMVLPAVTMEKNPQMLECQTEIHQHTDSCYDGEGNIICGYADFVIHTHDSSCYAEDGQTLICPLNEIEPHTHDDSCYRETRVQICQSEEGAGHTHDSSCYRTAEEPACGLEEGAGHVHEGHIHTEECYEDSEVLICGQEESETHTHTVDCYETQRKLICTQDTGCYDENGTLVCGQTEEGHTHTEACYPEELICGQEETEAHTHTDSCYEIRKELVCGKEEIIPHTHTAECYDENGSLVCGMLEVKEHIHDESCIPQTESKEADEEQTAPVQSGDSWAAVSKSEYTSQQDTTSSPAPQAETGSYDFTNDITSVTVERQQNGQWVQSDTFTEGDTVRITIRYAISAGKIDENQRNMHYQLPAGIALDENETGDVYLESGERAGTYTISADGLIRIAFDEAFANGEAFSGNLHFQGSISLTDVEEGEKIEFGGAGGTITVVPEEKQYSLVMSKVGVYVADESDVEYYGRFNLGINIQAGHLLYTIEVRTDGSSDGSDGAITVTDQFTHNPADGAVVYDENNIKIYKITPAAAGGPAPVEITEYELTYTHEQTGTDDTQTSSFTITGLPALNPGEYYSINYSAYPRLDTVQSADGYIAVPNTAAARDGSQTVSANATVEISRRMVHKTARANEGTGNVQWTVLLNEDGRDLSGLIFQDTMYYTLDGQAINEYDPTRIENLRVTAYELNDAGQQVSKGDVTAAFQELISYAENVMTVRFPAGGAWPEGLDSHWVYEITYETPFPEDAAAGEQIAFENTARLDEYFVTVNWNGAVPEPGYGLVKENTGQNLNTGTDIGTIDWQSTISYPADLSVPAGREEYAESGLDIIGYSDWMPDAYYDENGRFISGSHYTTAETLRGTLWITNAAGEKLIWGEDYTVSAVYADEMPDYGTFQEAWANTQGIFGQKLTEITDASDPDRPIAMFHITFKEESRDKLEGGQRLYISYRTLLNRQGVTDGKLVNIDNVGAILGNTVHTGLQTAFHQQLRKQVSATGMPPSGDDYNLDSGVYVDGPADIDLGDTGGKLYYRILFYNYGDTISFHDDMLEKFDGNIAFDQQMRIYDVITGETKTVKIWDYLDSSGKYFGNYTLKNLGQFQDCVIGVYYSIDVSGDEALAELGEGETHTYTNTVEWTGVGEDSAEARVTNSETTLKKTSFQTDENGETLVYYYVVVNPESRDLHPESGSLELQDNLTLPAGASATLRLETIGLYHYDAQNEEGHYVGAEVTDEEFSGFEVVQTEGAANAYTFTLPDEMACVVVYAYEIDPGTSALEEIQVNNTAALLGRAVISAGSDIIIQAQEAGAQVNKATLTIYKIGGNDVANLLEGVLFDLFRYEQQEDGSYKWVRTDLTAAGTEADDGGRHFITGGDGVTGAIILNFLEDADGNNSYYNTLYRLTEFETLPGYELDTTPRYYVWGEFGRTEEETAVLMADALQKAGVTWDEVFFIPFGESKIDRISNEPSTTSVTAAKQWLDRNGENLPAEDLPESITLTLYQHADGNKTAYGEAIPVRPDENGVWSYTWEDLPRKDDNGNYYTYSVEETAIGGDADMEGYEVSYRYPDGEGADTGIGQGEIQITNIRNTSYVLPETGGIGTAFFIIAGLFLAGAAGVGCLYIRRIKNFSEMERRKD